MTCYKSFAYEKTKGYGAQNFSSFAYERLWAQQALAPQGPQPKEGFALTPPIPIPIGYMTAGDEERRMVRYQTGRERGPS